MRDMNKILLLGRLGSDPTRRETKKGLTVVNFPLATSKRFQNDEGVETEETQWHRVYVWGKQGEACSQYLRKGDPVFIEGSMRSRKYDGKDGASKVSFEVHGDSVTFLPSRRSANAGSAAEAPAEAEADAVAASA